MERFKLDILALISEEVHHHLKIPLVRDVTGHDIEVCPVEEDLPQEFERLTFRHIVIRQD